MPERTLPTSYPFHRPSAVEPPPVYRDLRDRCPVAHVQLPSGDMGYVVSRYEDVKAVLGDTRFSRAATVVPGAPRLAPVPPMAGGLFAMDGPEHLRLRRLVFREFTARRVQDLEPRIQELTDTLLDAMESAGPTADLNSALAFPLPVQVICELLGVPYEDRARFRDWSDAFVSLTSHTPEEMLLQRKSLVEYLAGLVERKRSEPGDDLMSALVAAHDEGGRLSSEELVMMGITLLVAGHETTVSMISMFVLTLLRHPEQLRRLQEHPEQLDRAIDELLRINPIGDGGPFRVTTEEVEIAGTVIPEGSAVIAAVCSANRDERQYTDGDPELFDSARPSASTHLAFGHGAHHCVGSALARAELRTAIGTLFRRFPELRLAVPVEELSMTSGMMVHGLTRLPVTW